MRRRIVSIISMLLTGVLAAGVVVASARIAERHDEGPETAALARTPYELKFIDPDPNEIPFANDPGVSPPPLPTLPFDGATAAPARKVAPPSNAITAAHRAATQTDGDPASFHWALIVGINDYAGSTRDNIGSYQDAVVLRQHLLANGWRDDHIVFIGNRAATKPAIMQGLAWLASKTTERSRAIFHYSGHEKPFRRDVDGDGERRDIGLWVSDNNLISDGELGVAMGRVRGHRMWINLAVCRAGGFDDPGMMKPGRIITYSSPEKELSYEDPDVRHSVFGYYSIVEGMRKRKADIDGDGTVTVEEAFTYARPLVVQRTEGNQHPELADQHPGDFDLRIPL